MLHLIDVVQPKDGERISAVFRRHRLTLLWPLTLAAVCIITPFLFLFSLPRLGAVGIVLFVVALAVGIALAVRAFVMWDADALILTTHRLIRVDQGGLWHRLVSETALTAVQAVESEQRGMWEMLWQMGTVRITSSAANEITARRLWRPRRVQAAIQTATPSLSERRERLQRLLAEAPDETLETVETLLRKTGSEQP